MDENEQILDQEQYAKLLALQEDIQREIANAIRKGEETVLVRGKVLFRITLLKNDTDDETAKERFRIESDSKSIEAKATRDKKNNKIEVDVDFDNRTVKNLLNAMKGQKEREDARAIKKNRVDERDSSLLQKEIEEKKKTGKAVRLEEGREYSDRDNLIRFFREAVGEKNIDEIYRVQGEDNHDFKYVVKSGNNKYKTLNFKSMNEGKNPRQKVWLLKDGKLVQKRVDSLLVKGNYAIATDFPDSVISQNTTSYIVSRLPNGEYIGSEIAQKSGYNRNTSGDKLQKEDFSRTKSKYEFEDIVRAAEVAKNCRELQLDGKLTTEELELVKKIKEDKSLNNDQVKDIVSTIVILKKSGLKPEQTKEIIENAKYGKEIEKLAEDVKEAKEKGAKKEDFLKKYDEDQKMPGGGYLRRGYDPKHPE